MIEGFDGEGGGGRLSLPFQSTRKVLVISKFEYINMLNT